MPRYKIFPEPSFVWSEETPLDIIETEDIEKVLSEWFQYVKTWNSQYKKLIALSIEEQIEIN